MNWAAGDLASRTTDRSYVGSRAYAVQPLKQLVKLKPRWREGWTCSPSAPSLKTSNVLQGREDLPSTPDSAGGSWVTLPQALIRLPLYKTTQLLRVVTQTQRVLVDPLPRSKCTLKGVRAVSEVHEHSRPAFFKGNLRTLCLPVTLTLNLFKRADSSAYHGSHLLPGSS